MSDLPPNVAGAGHHDGQRAGRHTAWAGEGGRSLRWLHLGVSVLPTAVMALVGSGVLAFLVMASPSAVMKRGVLAGAALVAVLVTALAVGGAEIATRRVHRRLDRLRSLTVRSRSDLHGLVDRVRAGERFAPYDTDLLSANGGDPFSELGLELQRAHLTAGNAIISVADLTPGGDASQRLEVFVNIARRMQSMVHREIGVLDELEAKVEDPDLLKGLFHVDHLATRMRRQSESLAVLGGATSRRQWSVPVTVYEVVRSAIAEVEHYSRVKMVPPVDGNLEGSAVADVIHLIAELIENATKFSPNEVTIRTAAVAAGLAIEIDDRGLGMSPADQQRMNDVLADPSQINIGELLRDGRIGLFVVSALARRHSVRVQLQSNIYGGTQAVVVLPQHLVDPVSADHDRQPVPAPRQASMSSDVTHTTTQQLTGAPMPGTGQRHEVGGARRPAVSNRSDGYTAEAGGDRPGLPRRNSAASSEAQEAGRHHVPPGPAAPVSGRGAGPERPSLPQREVQQSLAPELRDGPPARNEYQDADHSPGLMAAFQDGFGLSEHEDRPGQDSDAATEPS